jgi:hypothetical protein
MRVGHVSDFASRIITKFDARPGASPITTKSEMSIGDAHLGCQLKNPKKELGKTAPCHLALLAVPRSTPLGRRVVASINTFAMSMAPDVGEDTTSLVVEQLPSRPDPPCRPPRGLLDIQRVGYQNTTGNREIFVGQKPTNICL